MNDPYLQLPLNGLRLIEASAGTGKTFTLATLFTRLVVEKGLRMGQILAVTFTDAATQELRGRIRERLELAARLLDDEAVLGDEQETVLTRALLDRYLHENAQTETHAQLRARLRLAAEETDLAAMLTIHGFCARVLREYALESGQTLVDAEIAPHPGELYAGVAADVWRRYGAKKECLETLTGLWNTPDELAADIPKLAGDVPLRPAAPMHELPDPRPLLEAAANTLVQMISRHLEAAKKSIEDAFERKVFNGRRARRASFDKAFDELVFGCESKHWSRGDQCHLEKLSAHRLVELCNEGKTPPISPLFDALQIWCEADDQKRGWLNQKKICLLHQLRLEVRQHLVRTKQQQRIQTYDDLIDNLAIALQGPHGEQLAESLRAQYRFALVDEFQDTDARQWEIFRRIFAAPGHHTALFLIGDPKQAIYGFRGGDVHTYLHAKSQAEPAPPLNRNFRSRPALLRAIQGLYDVAGAAAFAGTEIQFEPVQPGGRRRDGDYLYEARPAPALTVCMLGSPDGKPLTAEAARQSVTRACAADIHRVLSAARQQRALIDGRPVEPGDIAVLVRRHGEAARIQQALSVLGIPAVAAGRRSLFATDEARELRRVLLALLHPSDDGRLRTALSGVLLGQDAAAIAALDANSETLRDWQQRVFAWRERWQRAGIFALIAQMCAAAAQRLLALTDGERRVTNYLQLAEVLQDASPHLIGVHGLLDWLHTRMAHADDNDETQQLRLESDARCVQILTLHKSKGLEYPLVYLPFVGIDTKARNTARYREVYEQARSSEKPPFLRERGIIQHQPQRVLYWNTDPDSDAWKTACQQSEREERAEAARLLYVGLTRARHALWLAGGALPGLAQSPLGAMLAGTAVLAGEGTIIEQARDATEPLPRLSPNHKHTPPPPRTARRRIVADWWVHSFTQLARAETGQEASSLAVMTETGNVADDEMAVGPLIEAGEGGASSNAALRFTGSRFGNVLHAALEQTDFSRWSAWQPGAPAPDTQTAILRRALEREGYLDDAQDAGLAVLTAFIGHTLTTPLPEGSTLSGLPAHMRRAEMEFHFDVQPTVIHDLLTLLHAHGIANARTGFDLRQRLQGLMTGKIDLTYLNDGRWYVLDYKSNQLPRYDHSALVEAMTRSQYDLQALIYTLALHRWLRFRLRDEYAYERDFGGIRYLFCRGLGGAPGHGLLAHRFAPKLVHALDALFAGRRDGAAA